MRKFRALPHKHDPHSILLYQQQHAYDIDNDEHTHAEWLPTNIEWQDIVLLELRHVSNASWQPVLCRAVTISDSPNSYSDANHSEEILPETLVGPAVPGTRNWP